MYSVALCPTVDYIIIVGLVGRNYGPLLEDLIGILLQVEPGNRPSAEQILAIPAMQPYANTYVSRIRACRGLHSENTPSPALAGGGERKGTDSRTVKACESPRRDKENVSCVSNIILGPVPRVQDCCVQGVRDCMHNYRSSTTFYFEILWGSYLLRNPSQADILRAT